MSAVRDTSNELRPYGDLTTTVSPSVIRRGICPACGGAWAACFGFLLHRERTIGFAHARVTVDDNAYDDPIPNWDE